MNIEQLGIALSAEGNRRVCATLEELTDLPNDPGALYAALKAEDFDFFAEDILEIANNRVSGYTADRFQWAADNVKTVQKYEDDATFGADSIENAIARCWYLAELDDVREDIEYMVKMVKKLEF